MTNIPVLEGKQNTIPGFNDHRFLMSSWLQKEVKVALRWTDRDRSGQICPDLDVTLSNRLISATPLSQRDSRALDDITDHIQYGGIRLHPPAEDGGMN